MIDLGAGDEGGEATCGGYAILVWSRLYNHKRFVCGNILLFLGAMTPLQIAYVMSLIGPGGFRGCKTGHCFH